MGVSIKIPGKLVLQLMKEGDVFFFEKESKVEVPDHLHICVVKGSVQEPLIFACCTSQENTMNKLIKKQNLSSETIVYVSKKKYPFLTKDTFINCNNLFIISQEDFIADYDRGNIIKRESLDINHFSQIRNGILKSDLVEEEYKDMVSNISLDDYQK